MLHIPERHVWAAGIPVVTTTPEPHPDGIAPYVTLDERRDGSLIFAVEGGRTAEVPPDPLSHDRVTAADLTATGTLVSSEERVIIFDDGTQAPLDTQAIEALENFWDQQGLPGQTTYWPMRGALGLMGLVDVAPKRLNYALDLYQFSVTTQGIVLASLRAAYQRHADNVTSARSPLGQ